MPSLKWVCFDWGDTLADVRGTVEELQRDQEMLKALQHFGVKVSLAEFDEAYAAISRDFSVSMRGNVQRWQKGLFFHRLCERLNFPVTEEEASRMSDYYNQNFISKLKLLHGAKEVVEFAAGRVNLALISNANGERVRRQLEFFELRNNFSVIIISDELGFEKSSVEPFRAFLAIASTITPGLKPEECLMVGDRMDEDCFAKQAGMKAALVKRQHRSYAEPGIPPDYWVENLGELKELLEKLLQVKKIA